MLEEVGPSSLFGDNNDRGSYHDDGTSYHDDGTSNDDNRADNNDRGSYHDNSRLYNNNHDTNHDYHLRSSGLARSAQERGLRAVPDS